VEQILQLPKYIDFTQPRRKNDSTTISYWTHCSYTHWGTSHTAIGICRWWSFHACRIPLCDVGRQRAGGGPQAAKQAVVEAEQTHRYLTSLLYLLKCAMNDPKAVAIKESSIESLHSGVTISLCGMVPDFLYNVDPAEIVEDGEDEEMAPDICEISFPIVANEQDTAADFKLTTRTLQRWVKSGLRSFRLGKERYFSRDDVKQWAKKVGHCPR